jgi:hypothetical protein
MQWSTLWLSGRVFDCLNSREKAITMNMLPLIAASFVCCSLLTLFARHNKRTGWVKQHRPPLEELIAQATDWKEFPAPVRTAVNDPGLRWVIPPLQSHRRSSRDVTNFTMQLVHLQPVLAATASQPVNDRESAPDRVS